MVSIIPRGDKAMSEVHLERRIERRANRVSSETEDQMYMVERRVNNSQWYHEQAQKWQLVGAEQEVIQTVEEFCMGSGSIEAIKAAYEALAEIRRSSTPK
jgi:hypothetical protein